jgi:hypothetical protein
MKFRILIISLLMSAPLCLATGMPADSARFAPFHLSFITPLGTNGLESWNTTNNFSVNLFAGVSGGLNGVELGGFANGLRGDMKGVQIAGFCNNTFGNAEGAEIAGFWNYNHRNVVGFQASGFANAAIGYVDGFQASGFANYAHGTSFGQFSGFANLSTDKVYGVQASGFANVATANMKGLQGAGFANVAVGDLKGAQASGFANVVTGRTEGLQASGFINYTGSLRGVQIGFINFADTIEGGVPIGFMSFVRDGYLAMEIAGNESILGYISLKTGVKSFYNIISLGASIRNDRLLWGWGYGIGTMMPVTQKLSMSLEAVSYHLNEDRWYSGNINLLNRANLTVSYDLTPGFSVFAGPALNVWVTNVDSDGDPYTSVPFDAWTLYSRTHHRTEVTIYPGLSAGIRIKMN